MLQVFMYQVGYVPVAQLTYSPYAHDEKGPDIINPRVQMEFNSTNRDVKKTSLEEWIVFNFPIWYQHVKVFLIEFHIHVLAAILFLIVMYLMRKKGRQACRVLCLPFVWIKDKTFKGLSFKDYGNQSRKMESPAPSMFRVNGISFQLWIQLFEDHVHQYEKCKWKNILLMSIDPAIIKKITVNSNSSYEQVKKCLLDLLDEPTKFNSSIDAPQALESFFNCIKRSNESIDQYLNRLKSLAAIAEVTKEQILISFFIKNLKDETMEKFIRQSLALRESLVDGSGVVLPTLEMVVNYAKSYETSLFNSKNLNKANLAATNISINTVSSPNLTLSGRDGLNQQNNFNNDQSKQVPIKSNSNSQNKFNGFSSQNPNSELAAKNKMELFQYERPDYKSASGVLKIIGYVIISSLKIDPKKPLSNVEIKVADLNIKEDFKAIIDSFSKSLNFDNNTTISLSPGVFTIDCVQKVEVELEKLIKSELIKVAANNFNELTPSAMFCHKIELIDPNVPPVKQKFRAVPFNLREKFKAYLDEQLAAKLIEPSTSPWSSPINIVGKKDGGIRITQDYRLLNKLTVKDAYPLPVIDHLFTQLSKSKRFTKMDCFCGFYQIKLEEKSKALTGFTCEFGLFQFTVMPMGLTNAPATFQRVMNEIFRDLILLNIVLVFVDDLLVHSPNDESHIKNIKLVVDRLLHYGIKIKLSKCVPLSEEIKFLGHVVSFNSIKPDEEKIAAIKNFPLPLNLERLQSFMGLSGFYRKFIKAYAAIAKPIYALMLTRDLDSSYKNKNGTIKSRKVIVNWNVEAKKSFEILKESLCSETVLIIPDFSKEFVLVTDACDYAYGSILCQEFKVELKPVAYFSKQMNSAQQKYSTSEKELLSIVMSIEHFHAFLYGRNFKVYSDHQPLKWLLSKKGPMSSRLARWMIRINVYEFEIIYKTGKSIGHADALSRMPEPIITDGLEDNSNDIEDEHVICTIVAANEISANFDSDFEYPNRLDQSLDDDLKWLIKVKGNGKKFDQNDKILIKNEQNFVLIDNVLFFKKILKGKDTFLYVLPIEVVNEVLRLGHDSVYSGHMGCKKTLKRITERFYRPGLKAAIINYVKNCDMCQRVKNTQPKRLGNLLQLSPNRPNEIITMDVAGPFPKTLAANVYILIIVCAFTKFSIAFPIENTTALNIALVLIDNWICFFGIPEMILTDRGKNFQSMLLEILYEKLDIRQLRTTAYHPECDGQSERFVQTIKSMIRCYIDENQLNWIQNLRKLSFAYNSSVHASTGFTTFEMVFGQKPRVPLDLIYRNFDEILAANINGDDLNQDENVNLEYLFNHETPYNPKLPSEAMEFCHKQEVFKRIYEQAIHNRDIIMDKAKIRHNRNIKKFEYQVGDLVLTDHVKVKKGVSSGLAHKYHGPFIIVINNVDSSYNAQIFNPPNTEIQINNSIELNVDEAAILNPSNDEPLPNNNELNNSYSYIGSLNDLSFRPYYNKKTNRKYKKTNRVEPVMERKSTRIRKAPERFIP
ncbi:unnamed protein product [Brachionus calyciflorus]|uniref:Reverse transcriptase n=1 Tax=Brachionus calyciflorus TaxID=104777 RepID=A0A813YCT8_9BILA|nr:unnamed protein product [Brachionus calyciflorus]